MRISKRMNIETARDKNEYYDQCYYCICENCIDDKCKDKICDCCIGGIIGSVNRCFKMEMKNL